MQKSFQDNSSTSKTTLDQQDLTDVFTKMDAFLDNRNTPKAFIVIGSAFLIARGMPARATMDVDVWSPDPADLALIQDLSVACDLPIDPVDGLERPHLSLVGNEFVGLPDRSLWEQDVETFWTGSALTLVAPPIGIILGSKLAAFRAKDVADINWIVDEYPDWEQSLNQYAPLFSDDMQLAIDRNRIFIQYHIEVRDSRKTPEENAHLILPKAKP